MFLNHNQKEASKNRFADGKIEQVALNANRANWSGFVKFYNKNENKLITKKLFLIFQKPFLQFYKHF